MKSLGSKLLLGTSCFILGIGASLVAERCLHRPARRPDAPTAVAIAEDSTHPNTFPTVQSLRASMGQMDSMIDQFYKKSFFGGDSAAFASPFAEMRNIQAQMMKDFDSSGGNESGVAAIKKREDNQFVYYDIAVKGLQNEKLNVKVADGQIDISGRLEQKSNSSNGTGAYYSSTFQRSIPTPANVDVNKVQMLRTPDQLTLKFPKLEAS